MAERTPSTKPRSRSVFNSDLSGRSTRSSDSPSSAAHTPVAAAAAAAAADTLHPLPPPPPPPQVQQSTPLIPTPPSHSRRKRTSPSAAAAFSSRVTRASARQAASQTTSRSPVIPAPEKPADHPPSLEAPATIPTRRTSPRKRKSRDDDDDSHKHPTNPPTHSSGSSRQPKRSRRSDPTPSAHTPALPEAPPAARTRSRKGKRTAKMSSPGSASGPAETMDDSASTPRRSSRGKKAADDSLGAESSSGSSRRSKHTQALADQDTTMTGTEEAEQAQSHSSPPDPEDDHDGHDDHDDHDDHEDHDDDEHDEHDDHDEHDEDSEDHDEDDLHRYSEDSLPDPFSGGFIAPPRGSGLPAALSMLGGMLSMTGMGSRLRDILNSLRQKDDPSVQLIALQDLSEILLVSNEDNLSGSFSPDAYVRELVSLMQPNEITGEENPEVMLLACRCLANLMEALPASVANVVYGGAVPILCQKLLEISFIDLAEQALSTLEKISVEYPSSIVREGGLTACLSYLDFFATSTQRTAVTTAANCCRNIPEDSFPVVRDVMPILLNVLNSSDQRVVEQAALCVSRIVESFKHQPSKLEELVGVDMLKAILRLLLPGSTNHVIVPSLHTQFLRVLAITAHDSPRLAAELFKMNVVETLYQILTGVSPPSGTEDIASKLDSVLIMQALIHRPREQIIETLNVICNLLPREQSEFFASVSDGNTETVGSIDAKGHGAFVDSPGSRKRSASNEKRVELLNDCKDEVRRFALILFPTLTDAFSSTVNLDVRSKVLSAQLKMLSNFDRSIILESLTAVPYASFLASILSQQDHPLLVHSALQATELLMARLDDVYRYQLYREGVITEIEKISAILNLEPVTHLVAQRAAEDAPMGGSEPPSAAAGRAASASENDEADDHDGISESGYHEGDEDADIDIDELEVDDSQDEVGESHHSSDGEEEEEPEEGEDEENDNDTEDHHDEGPGSPASSEDSATSTESPPRRFMATAPSRTEIALFARKFLLAHETEKSGKAMRKKATKILTNISGLAQEISAFYLDRTPTSPLLDKGMRLFERLASFFDSDVLESVTSAELLESGVVRVLELVFSNANEEVANAAQAAFLEVFMGHTVKSRPKTATADSPATPFSVLIHKLQDLLSRSEHFEVITVHHNTFDANHSSAASMLAKQIRLRLVADDDSDIPGPFRSIMVSIHAIATFQALEDYLRPRISLSDRPRTMKNDGLSRALAAMAGSTGGALGASTARLAERSARLLAGGSMMMRQSMPPAPPEASGSSASRQPPQIPQTPPAPSASLRSSRKAGKQKTAATASSSSETLPALGQAPVPGDKAHSSRSSRRAPTAPTAPTDRPLGMPPNEADPLSDALECADEKQISDEDDNEMSDEDLLGAIVGDLDEEMETDTPGEPSAVNLEVAAEGKITARKEDGTRVHTPGQNSPSISSKSRVSALTAALQGSSGSPSGSAPLRPMPFVTAMQASQNWHMEFTINDKVVPMDSTVYRAVLQSTSGRDEHLGRSIWSTIHSVHYRRVPGAKPAADASSSASPSAASSTQAEASGSPGDSEMPDSSAAQGPLDKNPTASSILRLLRILHDLNANVDDVLVANKEALRLNVEPLSQFVNTKLTAKLNRQLEEPLIVASSCLPTWSEDLAGLYPFLFPFETRHLFLQSTSFGYARSMARWQNSQVHDESRRDRRDDRPYLGRLQRQKVRISRTKILESAVKVMELYGASQSMLEVEYFEEVGTGLGPTLEFYSTVSREFAKKKLKLWRDSDMSESEFVNTPNGLFPRPIGDEDATGTNGERILSLFRALGKFVARSMLDSRIIDINFNPIFFRIGDETSGVRPSLGAIKVVDPTLARSLQLIKKFALAKKEIEEDPRRSASQKVADMQAITVNNTHIDDLSLDFTLPGYPEIELVDNGAQVNVTIENVDVYIDRVVAMTLGSGVYRQVDAFRKGFSQVFPYSTLCAFTPDELASLFGRVDEDWSLETLLDSVKADHGFNMDSRSVKNLLQVMSELTLSERRDFLQFTTGSPKLPIGGFRSLTPMFTVVCKPSEAPYVSDDYLPSVMTCVNYLKLPDYTSIDVLRKRLFTAIKEGQGAFHLS